MNFPFEGTEKHRANLKKLALFLISEECYLSFNMANFCIKDNLYRSNPKLMKNECGTICCVVGMIPFISPESIVVHLYLDEIQWIPTCTRFCGIDDPFSKEFIWLFGGEWVDRDNSRLGAAKRILHFLRVGIPEDWEQQLQFKELPLSYNGEF